MNPTSENFALRPDDYGINRKAFSVRETAIALGISRMSVRRLIQRGLLRPNRALRHLLIPLSEIDRFLQQQR
jgi:excisionase family DNA binding protein